MYKIYKESFKKKLEEKKSIQLQAKLECRNVRNVRISHLIEILHEEHFCQRIFYLGRKKEK